MKERLCRYCQKQIKDLKICPDCHKKYCEDHINQLDHNCQGDSYLIEP